MPNIIEASIMITDRMGSIVTENKHQPAQKIVDARMIIQASNIKMRSVLRLITIEQNRYSPAINVAAKTPYGL